MATLASTAPRHRAVPAHAAAVGAWLAVVAAGYGLGARLEARDPLVHIGAPPLVGRYAPVLGAWALPALAFAVVAVAGAHAAVARLPWRGLLAAAWGAAGAWATLLALTDGPGALTAPLRTRYEYLAAVHRVGDVHAFLAHFTARLTSYPTHVKGHPPGMLLLLDALDHVGLGGAGVAATLVIAGGALAVPATLVTVRALAGETAARGAAPFLALAPAAVWVATSADALFMGVAACGVACVATRRALVGGLLLGAALMLTYGAAPLAVVVVAVAAAVTGRAATRLLVVAGAGVAVVVATFAALGFWWLDGLHATHGLYVSGVASRRPYADFLLIAPAALALATGPAAAAGIARVRGGLRTLAWAGVATVLAADLSGLSRGENERIWLLFTPWLLCAAAALPRPRRWLAAQVVLAVALQVGVRSPW